LRRDSVARASFCLNAYSVRDIARRKSDNHVVSERRVVADADGRFVAQDGMSNEHGGSW
jgi:hypothetical protein